MFQRFHEVKSPQEPELMQGGDGSRSSTPGVLDGRTIFQSHTSSMPSQQASVTSYPTISSPSLVLSRNSQVVTVDNNGMLSGSKYIDSPPEAHRYNMSDAYRLTAEVLEQNRYSLDPNRMSADPYRQTSDTQRIPIDIQRIRIEDQPVESYHRTNEDIYHNNNPVDLQRVPDANIQHVTAERLEAEIQRLQPESQRHINDLRSVPATEDLQRHNITDSTSPTNITSFTYRTIMTEPLRPPSEPPRVMQTPPEPPTRIIQESVLRTHGDLQRMVQESFGRDYFTNHRQSIENIRIAPDLRVPGEGLHYVTAESLHSSDLQRYNADVVSQRNVLPENLRIGAETPHVIITENLRVGAETPHSVMPENLRVTPDASGMVPENLCLTDPHQVLPENLHISHDAVVNGRSSVCNGDLSNGPLLSHPQPSESPMQPMRAHYEASHRLISEASHQMRDTMRIQSPHYSEGLYRTDLHANIATPAPPTPASSVPPMVESIAAPRYYSTYVSHAQQAPHPSILHNNQLVSYVSEVCDDRDMREPISLEEKIERGYHDIKPFDQDYPVSMPVMHMSQEPLPSATIPKPPKPKKPKEPKPPRIPVIHQCVECERIFKNSTQLKNHMWRHTGEKPFTCDECGSKFTQQGNLRAHRRIHTGERPYQCQECKACFTQLSTLKTHQKIHSDERPYKCDRCEAAFRQVANLKTHLVTHTGERPHKCDQCDKAFTQKSNLKAHKNRVHSGEGMSAPARRGRRKNLAAIKPFSCLECGAKFTIISNLKIHMKLHLGDKPFECDYCGAGFAQRSNLKTHVQRMHGRGPGHGRRRIRCDECPAMFRLKRCLKTHKKRRHPIKSLKIKILRQSKYLMNSNHVDEEGDDEDDDEEDEEEDEFDDAIDSNHVNCNSSSIDAYTPRRRPGNRNGHNDGGCENSITEPIVNITIPKQEPFDLSPPPCDSELESHFDYPLPTNLKKDLDHPTLNNDTSQLDAEFSDLSHDMDDDNKHVTSDRAIKSNHLSLASADAS